MGHHPCPNTPEILGEVPKSLTKEERGNFSPNTNFHGLAVLVDKMAKVPVVASPGPHMEQCSSTSAAPARPFTPFLRPGGLNLLSSSLQVSGGQSRRGCGTIPAVSAADGAKSMGTAVAHMGEAGGSVGATALQKGAALDQYITGAFRDSCPLHSAELRHKDAGDLETVYFCRKETGNSTQGYKYIPGFR